MLHFVFNVLILQFISFGSMFQDLPSLTHTKYSFAFPFIIFTFTSLYTHVHILSYHSISNTLWKKWCHLTSTFQWHLHNSNIANHLIVTHMSRLWPRKGACVFYTMTVAYSFDVEVRHCKFCECYDSLGVFWCLRFWFGKVINVFYFRTKEKEKETF